MQTSLTVRQAAAATGLSQGVLRRLCRDNRIPGAHLVRGVVRIPRSSVDALCFRHPTPAEAEERRERPGDG